MHEHDMPDGTLVFLCGADMNPVTLRARPGFAAARFIATGAIGGDLAERIDLPVFLAEDDIWGIVLRLPFAASPAPAPAGAPVTVRLRDRREARAILITDPASVGDQPEILAEARYWELPVLYRDRLESCMAGRQA